MKAFRNLLYLFSFFVPRKDSIWVFGAARGTSFSGSSKYLFLHVANNHADKIRPVWISENRETVENLRNEGYEAYYSRDNEGIWLNLRARYVFCTHSSADAILWCSGGADIFQLNHGTPLKEIGWESRLRGLSPVEKYIEKVKEFIYHRYEFWCVISEKFEEILRPELTFKVKNFFTTGKPRNEVFNRDFEGQFIGIKPSLIRRFERWNTSYDKVLLYMPTYRQGDTNTLPSEALMWNKVQEALDLKKFLLVVKPHPSEEIEFSDYDNIEKIENTTDIYPILDRTDALITDYSSIFFDYDLLNKPMIFLAFDLKQYEEKRGFYFTYKDIVPGPVAEDTDGFIEQLKDIENIDPSDHRKKPDEYYEKPDKNCERIYQFALSRLN